MFQSRISVIGGHVKDGKSDHLYDPLRKTFLEDTTAKKTYLQDISRFSHITHATKIHSYIENHHLGQNALILQDKKLVRKHNVTQLPENSRYYIVNAEQKQYDPISEDQLKSRLQSVPKDEQIIVYTYGDQDSYIQEQKIQTFKAPPRRKNSGIKVTQPKYNLFSMIDEPLNNILSGKSCTCPSNEIIATNRQEVIWDVKNND